MSAEHNKVARIFDAAVELETPAERAAYLDATCGQDQQLRAAIEELLRHDDAAGSFLNRPACTDPGTTVDEPIKEGPGTVIGPYKLLQQIGEGGMGTVFLAEQTQPVQRQVALKLIKPGMDSRQVIARFGAERQALALMDHLNIARILDAGATEAGRPYFVMELVHGVPITQYCDDNRLTPRERLELFVPVCQAIQHAHQKSIIHRDIKPSNVMVTLYDGKPVPKVIDFGVAKATEQRLTERTLFTQYGTLVGTMEYMSPEQAEMSALGVDTRSDIYSLGVLLYELLTGSTPLSHKRLKEAAYAEILRMIKEEEPPRPSTRLNDSGEALASISAQRHMEPTKLTKLVRGELDWIVMKALEKDRDRRYETASAFATDVQRYLNDEPVQACPPSAWYRFRKLARRNKRALATVTLLSVMVLVAVGAVAGSIGWALREKAAGLAATTVEVDRALAESAEHQRHGQIPKALQAVKNAQGALASGTADELLGQRVQERARDLQMVAELDDARLETYAASNTSFERIDLARLDEVYARMFEKYGLKVEGLDPEEAGKRIQQRTVAVELAAALDNWAMSRWLKWDRGQRKADPGPWKNLLAVARAADRNPLRNRVREALGKMDQKALAELLASLSPADLPVPTILQLAEVHAGADRPGPALALLRRAQRLHPDNFWINHHLARSLRMAEPTQWDEVIRYYSAALACRPDSAAVCRELGIALAEKGKFEEAEAYFLRSIECKPDYGTAYFCLGNNFRDRGEYDKAQRAYLKAIAINSKDHEAYLNLGNIHFRQKKWAKAAESYRTVADLQPNDPWARLMLGQGLLEAGELAAATQTLQKMLDDQMKSAEVYYVLGRVQQERKNWPAAEKLFQQAVQENPLPPKPRGRFVSRIEKANIYHNLGVVLSEQKKLDEASQAFRTAVKLKTDFAEAHHNLGVVYFAQKNWPAAQASFAAAAGIKKDYAEAHFGLGTALVMLKRQSEAIPHFKEAVKLKPAYDEAHFNLGLILEEQGDRLKAADHFLETVKVKPGFAKGHYHLGVVMYQLKKLPEAEKALRKAVALDNKNGVAHYSLGLVVSDRDRPDEAEKWYRKAIKLQPDLAEAHCNLGHLLRRRGEFAEALRWFRSGHELGSKIPKDGGMRRKGWHYPSERWVKDCEVLVEEDKKLADALKGDVKNRDANELVELAAFCMVHKRLSVAAAKLYAEVLEADRKLSAELRAGHLYNAARAAALAGAGQGLDAAKLNDNERARWRRQALDWLRAALAVWTKRAEAGTPAVCAAIYKGMQHWQMEPDLAGIREETALAKLPEAERDRCRKLWADVEALQTKVKPKAKELPEKP
jgi:eukaryotic-like serine/threonine-protein kinase